MRIKILLGVVLFVHLVFCFTELHEDTPPSPIKKSIAVHTYIPPPLSKPIVRVKSPAKKKVKPQRPCKNKKILKDLQESLAKLSVEEDKKGTKFDPVIPPVISQLQIDSPMETGSDIQGIVGQLRESLTLPEIGEVEIELTLSRAGGVRRLRVIRSESTKNRRYVERRVPKLKFSPFKHELKKDGDHTITLIFCNED